jgi:hypothetical protein
MFYDKPVALNKTKHKNLKVKAAEANFGFAANTNSVILAGMEFAEAAKEFPIVFATTANDKMVPVALMGLRNNENLFVDGDGKWLGKYIPAFVRRYPFVLAEASKEGELVVCIDESFSGFSEKEGEALFEKDGKNSAMLDKAVSFLREYQKQYQLTEAFLAELKELDLFQTLNARIDMKDGRRFALANFQVIDEKKLLGLDEEKAMKLFKQGRLAWVYAHLISLGNLGRLVDRIPAEQDAA